MRSSPAAASAMALALLRASLGRESRVLASDSQSVLEILSYHISHQNSGSSPASAMVLPLWRACLGREGCASNISSQKYQSVEIFTSTSSLVKPVVKFPFHQSHLSFRLVQHISMRGFSWLGDSKGVALPDKKLMLQSWIPSTSCMFSRHFSSKPQCISMDNFSGTGSGDGKMFIHKIQIASDEIKANLDIGGLKTEFESEFRPILASHCLILPHGVEDSTAFLDGQAHGSSKEIPLYLSSLDIMTRMKSLKECQRKPLLDFIIRRRVFVADEWNISYGNIEVLEYEFEEDVEFVCGECDVSFVDPPPQSGPSPHKQSGPSPHTGGAASVGDIKAAVGAAYAAVIPAGKAKFSFIIWRGRQLLCAEIFEGIPRQNNHHAEVLAALALLMKCEELNLSKVKLWTDSPKTTGVINGSETIQVGDSNRYTYLLLRAMHYKFTKLVAVHKPRELMFLADQLLRLEGFPRSIIDEAIKLQSEYLSGCPLFSITCNKTTGKIIKAFGIHLKNMKKAGYAHSNGSVFFCKVGKEDKFSVFERIRSGLSPAVLKLFWIPPKPT